MDRSRNQQIANLRSKRYDILIIGGGITGACIARDAALRGFTVACVDKNDWAFGTSSRSSRLIHGGIRYLELFDFKLVFEACRERRQLLLNAPHLVYPQPFAFPIYKGDKHGVFMIECGLILYDILALFRNVRNHRMYGPKKALSIEENLNGDILKGMGLFYDCSTNDSRLTLAFIMNAIEIGADCANYLEATALLKQSDMVSGARLRDALSGDEFDVEANIVINATGAWGDEVCRIDDPSAEQKLFLTKGSHIVVPRDRVRTVNAMPMISPSDQRLMFLIPRGDFAIIGTTDINYEDDLDHPYASSDEIDYILEAANHTLPRANLDRLDIISTYSGLRPLVMESGGADVAASKVSREHRIYEGHSGLLTISGGKLTTARSMAKEIVDIAVKRLRKRFGTETGLKCMTFNNPILGTPDEEVVDRVKRLSHELRFDDDVLATLLTYGTEAIKVLVLASDDPSLSERVEPTLPYIGAQVRYAVEMEMALNLEDFMVRRSEIFFNSTDQGMSVAPAVAEIMGEALGWGPDEKERQIAAYGETVSISKRYQL